MYLEDRPREDVLQNWLKLHNTLQDRNTDDTATVEKCQDVQLRGWVRPVLSLISSSFCYSCRPTRVHTGVLVLGLLLRRFQNLHKRQDHKTTARLMAVGDSL